MPRRGDITAGARDTFIQCRDCGTRWERNPEEIMRYERRCSACRARYRKEYKRLTRKRGRLLRRQCAACQRAFYLNSANSPDTLCEPCWERSRVTRLRDANKVLRNAVASLKRENTLLKEIVNPTTEEQWIKKARYLRREAEKLVKQEMEQPKSPAARQ